MSAGTTNRRSPIFWQRRVICRNAFATDVSRLNGVPVPRAMWRHVRPKQTMHDVVVDFIMPLRDGGGSGRGGDSSKNPAVMVALIAVLIVSAAVNGGALGLPAAGILSAAAVNSVVGAAIGKAGQLETSALGAIS
jgi:hypothetical protein